MTKLTFENLTIRYASRAGSNRREVDAVKGIDLVVESGSTLGLAGESGSGKSTLAMSMLRLLPKNAKITGRILLDDESVTEMTWGQLRAVRWTQASIVFQGAMHALNPVQRVRDQIAEALALHATGEHKEYVEQSPRYRRVDELLQQVDLPKAKGLAYPHELSGGQKQRIGIARALSMNPKLLVADEPTSALDVSVQATVLDLLKDLQHELGFACLFVTHDLAVVDFMADRIAVMQRGKIVEVGNRDSILRAPQHPYTQRLIAAIPVPDPDKQRSRRELRKQILESA